MKDRAQRQQEILEALTEEITSQLNLLSLEERRPGADPDASERLLRELRESITQLRRIREELENTFSGATTTED